MSKRLKQTAAMLLTLALASALCLALYAWDNKYTCPGAQPLDGLLALSPEELTANNLHFLINGWRFYPDVLLTPQTLADAGDRLYMDSTAIGQHTNFALPGADNPHGCGAYVLTIQLPSTPAEYALELPEVYSACQLYLNDQLLLQIGDPSTEHYQPITQNQLVCFQASGQITLLLAVSNYSHFYSGLVYPPAFGSPQAVSQLRELRLALAACAVLIGLLGTAFSCYLGIKMRHQNALLFALLCLTSVLLAIWPILHSLAALPPLPWYALEAYTANLMIALVLALQMRLCQAPRRLQTAAVTVGLGFCLLTLVYGLLAPRLTLPLIQLFSALLFAYKAAAAICLLAVPLRAAYRPLLLYAALFYGATLLWDRILPAYEPVIGGWFASWGGLALILAIGCTLWRDVITTYSYNMAFAEEHRQTKRQLAMQVEYANQMAEHSAASRKLLHDFRQHLRAITEMAAQIISSPETAVLQQNLLRYLQDVPQIIPQSSDQSVGSFCNHASVDALLQYYHAAAVRQNINAHLALNLPDGLPLNDLEWCSLLGNLLENAIEACQRQKPEVRSISISARLMPGTFFLLVENSYDGQYSQQNGRFLSRKTNSVRYGLGLESVREIVTTHGGTLDIYPLRNIFRIGITLPTVQKQT